MSHTAAVGRAIAVLLVVSALGGRGRRSRRHGGTALRFGGPQDVDAAGVTPLHRAVESDDATAVEQLIRGGADVNAVTRFRVTPLSIATLRGNVEIARALLAAGANPNAVMGAGEPIILTAARTGNVNLLKALVDQGADVNARERFYGQTPLMWAAIEDHGPAIQMLAAAGADVNARANMLEGEPTWRYGADSRNGINGEALQNFNTNFSKGGLTPLMYAAREGSTSAVRALMDAGASHQAADPEGFTPLLLAILNGHYDTAAALVEKGADVNQGDRSGQTPLFAVTDLRSLLWVYNRPPAARPQEHARLAGAGEGAARQGRQGGRQADRPGPAAAWAAAAAA